MRLQSLVVCFPLLVGVPLVASPEAAHAASVSVSGYAQAGLPQMAPVEESFEDEPTEPPAIGSAQATDQLSGDTVSSAAQTEARAELGLLTVSATSSATGGAYFEFPPPGSSAQGVANPRLHFEDTIRVLAPDPSLSFLPGTLVVRLFLDATSAASSGAATPLSTGGRVEYVMNVGLGNCMGCFDGVFGFLNVDSSGSSVLGELPPLVFESRPLEFRFDQFVDLQVDLSAIATAIANSTDPNGVSRASFGGELRWGGVVEVRAGAAAAAAIVGGGGAAGPDESLACSIESISGIDWCLPVPEAHSDGLALAALLSLRAVSRRRARSDRTQCRSIRPLRS